MDSKALIRATAIGTAAQLGMIAAGHFVPFIRDHVFMIGGLLLSLAAALIYALRTQGGMVSSLLGGLIAGAVCAAIAIAVSVALHDTPANILVFGTMGSAIAGVIGGGLGIPLRTRLTAS